MPISRSRKSALTASVACIEDRTRWPVIDAWTAISAVSRSRISPTRITSGSWRRIARRPRAKVSPAAAVDLGLVDVLERVLDRVLDGRHVERGAVEAR
jgi:hypothetical protein